MIGRWSRRLVTISVGSTGSSPGGNNRPVVAGSGPARCRDRPWSYLPARADRSAVLFARLLFVVPSFEGATPGNQHGGAPESRPGRVGTSARAPRARMRSAQVQEPAKGPAPLRKPVPAFHHRARRSSGLSRLKPRRRASPYGRQRSQLLWFTSCGARVSSHSSESTGRRDRAACGRSHQR